VIILTLLELLLMIAAPVAHIVLCVLNTRGRVKISITIITISCLLAGFILPVLASYIAILNLSENLKCATGLVGFAVIGLLLSVVVIPLSALIFYMQQQYDRRKNAQTTV